jgi:hypothetical protein
MREDTDALCVSLCSKDVLTAKIALAHDWVRQCTRLILFNFTVVFIQTSFLLIEEISLRNSVPHDVAWLERLSLARCLPSCMGNVSVVNRIISRFPLESAVP